MRSLSTLCLVFHCLVGAAFGQAKKEVEILEEEASLAAKSQNPVGDLISLPFQNNLNFDVGPDDRTQNILNIQPVIPIKITKKFNLISRTIAPVIGRLM